MNRTRHPGLLLGLMVALVAVGITASSASTALPAAQTGVPPSTIPATAIAALRVTAQETTSALATASPSPAPSSTPTPKLTPSLQTSLSPPTPSPNPSPSPTPTAAAHVGHVIGRSVQDRPIWAHRIGRGPLKVVLVGDIHGEFEANTYALAQQLLEHFQAHPEEVPPSVSLWIIPTMNPDGLATGHRWNANDVDLNRNADTDLDGCAGNDWSPDTVGLEGPHPGAGGAYPFSEPETQAIRDFMSDAWIAVFYHSAAEAIFIDTCQRHAPTARLAEALSQSTGYPVPEEGWAGYPITGDFGDYLAGEGVAAVTVELFDKEDPEFDRNLKGVQSLLATTDDIISAEATQAQAEYTWLSDNNTGVWSFEKSTFIHPLGLEVLDDTAFLLDAGRILALDLSRPGVPRLLLAPGDQVEGTRVQEPLDLAVDGTSVLVLDRAGDVYRYDPGLARWVLERYDRPPSDTYDHYYVALSADGETRYLLNTTQEQVWRYSSGQKGAAWLKLPQSRDVDLSAAGSGVYVLTRSLNAPRGSLSRYRDAQKSASFQPNIGLMHPRQVLATDAAVFVLDRAGRRLLSLDPDSGELRNLYQFTDRRAVSALWASPSGNRLILAGENALYFYDEPDRMAIIEGGPMLDGPQPHDDSLFEKLRGLQSPIEGATLTSRDFQMPGAPRHYRLGVHEGMDFYGHTVGVPVDRRTAVRSVADGTVIRALVDYEPLTAAQADAWSAQCQSLGYTPAEVLDGYRGRQVWIDHGNGLVSRYAHLSSIAPEIVEGAVVVQGQVIATVGNSGTPSSLRSETYDVHLHLELWIGDHYAGQFLRPIEAREWLEKILR